MIPRRTDTTVPPRATDESFLARCKAWHEAPYPKPAIPCRSYDAECLSECDWPMVLHCVRTSTIRSDP